MGEVVSLPRERTPRPEGLPPLPHSKAAEEAVICSAIQDATAAVKAAELLRREHFFDQELGWIFYAVVQLRGRATPIGRVTVEAWLHENGALEAAGGEKRVRALADAFPEPSQIEAHAAIVVDAYRRRELALVCRRVDREACAPVADVEALLAKAGKELRRVTAPKVKITTRPIGAAGVEAHEDLLAAHLGKVSGVRYWLPRLEALLGLLVARQQTIVAGPSEHGKTPFSTQVAVEVAAGPLDAEGRRQTFDALGFGEAVYFVTAEMPRRALLTRLACSYARVDVSRALLGGLDADELDAVGKWLKWLNGLAIEVDEHPAPADVLAKRVRDAKEAFAAGTMKAFDGAPLGRRRLRLVIGDHAQELERFAAGGNQVTRLGNVAAGWRDEIAKGCEVATMLLSQVRAPTEDERKASPGFPPWPTVDWLFGSPNAMKSTADTVLAVQQPWKILRGKLRKQWQDVACICALKRRFSGRGQRIALRFDRGLFHDDLPLFDRDAFESEGA